MPDKSREQKLVDLMFTVALKSARHMDGKSNEEIAAWVAMVLKENGFPTQPMGISWGVLINTRDPEMDLS